MAKHPFQLMIEFAGFEPMSYSGRGMYGKECIAVDLPGVTVGTFLAVTFEEHFNNSQHHSGEEQEAFAEALRSMQTDSLGRGTVIYFPGIPFTGDDE